ncbi:MAG: hypothetical protein KatS3mg090_0858 [Patescibacteria group bacterium]|nr:MAG: hypothetical protein KatS3mg090_0858 [Patescibacteria group bacterium]
MRKLAHYSGKKYLILSLVCLSLAGYIFFNIPPETLFIILSFCLLVSLGLSFLSYFFYKKDLIKFLVVYTVFCLTIFLSGLNILNIIILSVFAFFIFFIL